MLGTSCTLLCNVLVALHTTARPLVRHFTQMLTIQFQAATPIPLLRVSGRALGFSVLSGRQLTYRVPITSEGWLYAVIKFQNARKSCALKCRSLYLCCATYARLLKFRMLTTILPTNHVFCSVTVCQLVNCYVSDERFGLQHSRVRLDSQTNKNTVHKTKVITIMGNGWEWFNLKYVRNGRWVLRDGLCPRLCLYKPNGLHW